MENCMWLPGNAVQSKTKYDDGLAAHQSDETIQSLKPADTSSWNPYELPNQASDA